MAAGRQVDPAQQARRGDEEDRRGGRGQEPAAEGFQGHRPADGRAHDRGRHDALSAPYRRTRPRAPRRAFPHRRPRLRAAGRCRRDPRAGRRLLATRPRPLARRRDDAPTPQRDRDRHLGAAQPGRCRPRRRVRRAALERGQQLAGARDRALLEAHPEAPRRLLAQPDRAGRARLLLRRHSVRARAGRRPLLHAGRHVRGLQPARGRDQADGDEFRPLPDGQRPDAARHALPVRSRARRQARRGSHLLVRCGGGGGARPRHLHARRHRLGRRSAACHRGARRLLARRADRHGSQSALRRTGDDGDQDIRPPLGLAELDLPAAQRHRRGGRAEALRHRQASQVRPQTRLRETTMSIDYTQRIPNNVDLASDRRLQRALENWQPRFLDWWRDMGPDGTSNYDVYLRTAISADANGWAHFGYVKMPDYRWGIFLAGQDANRTIAYGDNKGKPAWQEVPGELRSTLRRLIVTQGDTEPASVEQQRLLGKTAPSLYDLRNVFQINCEEGRHLWAMVYLLHAYFGRDGREEAEMLLERHSGDPDKPRILGAFNEKTPDWLSFFMFTYFTDRDGKYQLASLAESGFDPLSRSCRFMLIEEAHHMFVGESGVQRIIQRTCDLMKEHKTDDVRAFGAIDLTTMQKYLNFHFSVSLDLFGQAASTNAANYYTMGVKGRYLETRIGDDHVLTNDTFEIDTVEDGRIVRKAVPALAALNERLRNDYVEDCAKGLLKWNKVIADAGIAFELKLPHRAFNRRIGAFSELNVSPDGKAVSEPGKFANWIAPPQIGINRQPANFEYVRFN